MIIIVLFFLFLFCFSIIIILKTNWNFIIFIVSALYCSLLHIFFTHLQSNQTKKKQNESKKERKKCIWNWVSNFTKKLEHTSVTFLMENVVLLYCIKEKERFVFVFSFHFISFQRDNESRTFFHAFLYILLQFLV